MNGNTKMTAEAVADELSAELIEIKPVKEYPDKGFRKFIWGGKSAVMAETPKLQPYEFRADEYERIIFGFPVWASNVAPPIRTFVQENREALQNKQIAAFTCQSGNGGEKACAKLAKCLGQESLTPTVVLIDPKTRPKPENESGRDPFRCFCLSAR